MLAYSREESHNMIGSHTGDATEIQAILHPTASSFFPFREAFFDIVSQ